MAAAEPLGATTLHLLPFAAWAQHAAWAQQPMTVAWFTHHHKGPCTAGTLVSNATEALISHTIVHKIGY